MARQGKLDENRFVPNQNQLKVSEMRVVTFGEVMIRLAPPEELRLRQVMPGSLDVTFGGGEVNVAVSIVYQGGEAAFLTALPDNPLTDCFAAELRKFGVKTDLLTRTKRGRFGIYFVETGAKMPKNTGLLMVKIW